MTMWNGQLTPVERVMVKVGKVINPEHWAYPFQRQERPAVIVHYKPDYQSEQTMILDNIDGQGWHKVTIGGGPEWGHKSLPENSEILGPDLYPTCRCGEPYDKDSKYEEK